MDYIHFRVGVWVVINKNVSLLIDNLRQLAAEAILSHEWYVSSFEH